MTTGCFTTNGSIQFEKQTKYSKIQKANINAKEVRKNLTETIDISLNDALAS